jgi:ABC-type bacteriocin/lantibiotic exporter with double-glycine peptidase domain
MDAGKIASQLMMANSAVGLAIT